MEAKKRLVLYLNEKKIGQTALEKTAGLSRGLIAKKQGLTSESLGKIALALPELNISWLLTGKGEMEISKEMELHESDESLYHYTSDFDGFINMFKKKIKPHYNDEDLSYIFGDLKEYKQDGVNINIPDINAVPIFCLCDIPKGRHELHQNLYGIYGIGFNKEWAKKGLLNPVIYCHKESLLSVSLRKLFIYFIGMKLNENMNEKEKIAYCMFNYILIFCKPYDNLSLENGNKRYYDEKEWRYIGLCGENNEIPLSILYYKDKGLKDDFQKKKGEAQDRIMETNEMTLKFTIDDITHIILPTEEKKDEFLKKIAEIEEYRNDIDKISNKIIIGHKNIERKEKKEDDERLKLDVKDWKDKYTSLFNEIKREKDVIIDLQRRHKEETDQLHKKNENALNLCISLQKQIATLKDELGEIKNGLAAGVADVITALTKTGT